MIKLENKKEQMSAVDELIKQRGIETEATRSVDKMKEYIVEASRERVIELCTLSRENLQNQIDATLVELLIDDACDEESKALSGKEFQLKNNVYYTQKRIDAITSLINELGNGETDGPMPEAD